jgi:hypothetical protein
LVPGIPSIGGPFAKVPLNRALGILARKLHCNQGSPMSASIHLTGTKELGEKK